MCLVMLVLLFEMPQFLSLEGLMIMDGLAKNALKSALKTENFKKKPV